MAMGKTAPKIKLSINVKCFFEVEIENENHGGIVPATTLDSANDSLSQAPEDVVAGWTMIDLDKGNDNSGEPHPEIVAIENEVEELIKRYGGDCLLRELLDDTAESICKYPANVNLEQCIILRNTAKKQFCYGPFDTTQDAAKYIKARRFRGSQVIIRLLEAVQCDENGNWVVQHSRW